MEGARKVIMPLLSEVAVESSLLLVYQINKSEMEWTSLNLFLGSSSFFFKVLRHLFTASNLGEQTSYMKQSTSEPNSLQPNGSGSHMLLFLSRIVTSDFLSGKNLTEMCLHLMGVYRYKNNLSVQ